MFSQLRLIDPPDAPPLFVSELITMANKFFCSGHLLCEHQSTDLIQNLFAIFAHKFHSLANLAATRLQIFI
jgi:hypothetical protein